MMYMAIAPMAQAYYLRVSHFAGVILGYFSEESSICLVYGLRMASGRLPLTSTSGHRLFRTSSR